MSLVCIISHTILESQYFVLARLSDALHKFLQAVNELEVPVKHNLFMTFRQVGRANTSAPPCYWRLPPLPITAHLAMMILTVEEKAPPPYTQHANSIRSSRSSRNCDARLNRLPPHILLQVIYWTCPDGIVPEERRFMLHWMSSSLRYVCRSLWTGEFPPSLFVRSLPMKTRIICSLGPPLSSYDAHPAVLIPSSVHASRTTPFLQ